MRRSLWHGSWVKCSIRPNDGGFALFMIPATKLGTPPAPARRYGPPSAIYPWYVLGVLFLVYAFNFIDRNIISILAQDIKASLHVSDAQLGFLYGTAFAIFYSIFGIPLGRLADQWYRGRLIAAGLAVWSFMTAASGLASSYGQLALARVGIGIGEASATPAAYSLLAATVQMYLSSGAAAIQDTVLPRMRGVAGAIYLLSLSMVGLALGPYSTGKVAALTGSLRLGLLAVLAVIPPILLLLWISARGIAAAEDSRADRARAAGEGS